MKKCAPGIICIENMTALLIIVIIVILYFVYLSVKPHHYPIVIEDPYNLNSWFPSWPYNSNGLSPPDKNIIANPYVPPLRDERYLIDDNLRFVSSNALPPFSEVPVYGRGYGGRIPINVSTNIGAVDTQYRQLGILTPLHGTSKDNILPLMGRPLFTNRNMWNYFTTSNQYNNVKLPISRKGKSCTSEYGCNKLYNGDIIHIEGINEAYRFTEYDNDTIRYLPFV